jgi:uncharacterized membrane protein
MILMSNDQNRVNQLLEKLDALLNKQEVFSREINDLRQEIYKLQGLTKDETSPEKTVRKEDAATLIKESHEPVALYKDNKTEEISATEKNPLPPQLPKRPKVKSDLEKFIGENLINKIGIAITVIGVSIGAKYAIDHQLISPLTRILLGYLLGAALLGFALRLKKNYENFSAVLLSGSMAILYFITYTAYSFYDIIPQTPAFALMVVFTAFTVLAALHYKQQVIAQIGLVGAYAIPFLVGGEKGNIVVLFSYITIINAGILAIAFKKYWKALYYSSFGFTWLIYLFWYISKYQVDEFFTIALVFQTVFFVTFYLTFLAYKLFQKESFKADNTILLLLNSFVYYGLGIAVLAKHDIGKDYLGLFTVINALLHFTVTFLIYRYKSQDKKLFFLMAGLALAFITLAIPVQLDGNWVTLLWAAEAALLFSIGRTKGVAFYEKISIVLMLLAFLSIMQDWSTVYNTYIPEKAESRLLPLFNVHFLSSLLFIGAISFIAVVHFKTNDVLLSESQKRISGNISVLVSAILLISMYYTFRLEIANYWHQLFQDSKLTIDEDDQSYPKIYHNYDFDVFKIIWIINYSLLFTSVMAVVNFKRFKNENLGMLNLGLLAIAIVVFLAQGLYLISELRVSYLEQNNADYFQIGTYNIWIRYISFAFVAAALLSCYQYTRQQFIPKDFSLAFDILLYTSIIWIASSELIHWMDMAQSTQSYKLGLSILWGVYSLLLIVMGIWKKKKHLRIGAISLFGATLLKLFFYDISHLDTIAKTIVFVSLGILLLIISFLYNKYKLYISDETDT